MSKVNALDFHSRRREKSTGRLLEILYEADEEDNLEELKRESRTRSKKIKKYWSQVKGHVNQMSENDPIRKVLWAFRNLEHGDIEKEDSKDLVAAHLDSSDRPQS